MKNKVFIVLFSVLLLFGLIAPPITRILAENGIVEFEDLANYIEPEKVAPGPLHDLLQGIENGKAEISDTYINYLPLYGDILSGLSKVKSDINRPTTSFLSDWGVELLNANKVEGPDAGNEITPSETTNDDSDKDDPVTTTTNTPPTTTPSSSESTLEHPAWIDITDEIKSEFHSPSGITNYYVLEAKTVDGKTIKMVDRAVTLNYEDSIKRADGQIAELNRLAASEPDVNFYVYLGTRLQETPDSAACFPDVENAKDVLDYFEDNLSDSIEVAHFTLNSFEDRVNYYYLTDHHWTAKGVLRAYNELIELLQRKATNIADARVPVAYHELEGIKFNGTHSRELAMYDFYDPFCFYDFNIPAFNFDNGASMKTMARKFLRGGAKSGSSLYQDYYAYSSWYEFPKNETGRNLLIIGDSFMYCQAEALASHFDNTYTLHIEMKNKEIDYNEYVKKHKITDVLVLCYDLRLIYAHIGDIHLERILTD